MSSPTTDLREIRKRMEQGMCNAREAAHVFNLIDRMDAALEAVQKAEGCKVPSGVALLIEQARAGVR